MGQMHSRRPTGHNATTTKRCVVKPVLACRVTRIHLRVVTASKLLGVGCAGGRKRTVKVARKRMTAYQQRLNRIRAFRKVGGCAATYATTAGLPSVLYGADAMGIATSTLKTWSAIFARAVAPIAGGKNPDRLLHALDAAGKAADPALQAHTLPIVAVAMAAWERWVPLRALSDAFDHVLAEYPAGDVPWAKVAGPVAAATASAARIGWRFVSATRVIDDLGVAWDVLRNSPACIRAAVAAAVRRWRFARVAAAAGAVPAQPDVAVPVGRRTLILDATRALRGLLTAGKAVPTVPTWGVRCRPWLASALSGGQWPQARRAMVRGWQADSKCQLCLAAEGTVEHRRECTVTRPADGWGAPPAAAEAFLAKIGADRTARLRRTGIVALRVPAPLVNDEPVFRWRTAEPDLTDPHLRYVIDGSLKLGRHDPFQVAAAAVVIIDRDGRLAGILDARLPSTVRTSAAAEAWAAWLAFSTAVGLPQVLTDCQSLVLQARGGTAAATAAKKPLAAEWARVAAATEVPLQRLVDEHRLVWMPAHLGAAAAAGRLKSDGSTLTAIEWRANRLADAVAKAAADVSNAAREVVALLDAAAHAVRHEAAVLGATTYAANNHRETVTRDDGRVATVIRRDSAAAKAAARPWRSNARSAERRRPCTAAARSAETQTAGATGSGARAAAARPGSARRKRPRDGSVSSLAAARSTARRTAASRSAALSAFVTEGIVDRIGRAATRRSPSPDRGDAVAFLVAAARDEALGEALVADSARGGLVRAPRTDDVAASRGRHTGAKRERDGQDGTGGLLLPAERRRRVGDAPPRRPSRSTASTSASASRTDAPLADLLRAHSKAYARPKAPPRPSSLMRLPPNG